LAQDIFSIIRIFFSSQKNKNAPVVEKIFLKKFKKILPIIGEKIKK